MTAQIIRLIDGSEKKGFCGFIPGNEKADFVVIRKTESRKLSDAISGVYNTYVKSRIGETSSEFYTIYKARGTWGNIK